MSAPGTIARPPVRPDPVPSLEFSPELNVALSRLASRMRFVGWALIVVAGVLVLWSLLGTGHGDMIAVQVALVLGFIGLWSVRAASEFARVVTTSGLDVHHLMRALAEIAKLYELQYWVFVAAALLLLVTVVMAVTGGSWLPLAW
jgi:hypothetical protein